MGGRPRPRPPTPLRAVAPAGPIPGRRAEERKLTPLQRLEREFERRQEEVAHNLVSIAATDRSAAGISAARVIMDRLYGRPTETVREPVDNTLDELLALTPEERDAMRRQVEELRALMETEDA